MWCTHPHAPHANENDLFRSTLHWGFKVMLNMQPGHPCRAGQLKKKISGHPCQSKWHHDQLMWWCAKQTLSSHKRSWGPCSLCARICGWSIHTLWHAWAESELWQWMPAFFPQDQNVGEIARCCIGKGLPCSLRSRLVHTGSAVHCSAVQLQHIAVQFDKVQCSAI